MTDRRKQAAVGLAGAVALAAGVAALAWWLGRPEVPPMGPVEGIVTLDGKPLDTVEVVFLPDPTKGTTGARSACYTDKDGKFKLFTERYGKDGAVVGTHRVLIRDITALPAPPGSGKAPGAEDGSDSQQAAKSNPIGLPRTPEELRKLYAAKPSATKRRKPTDPDENGIRLKSRVPADYEDANKTPFQDVKVSADGQTLTLDVVTKGKK